MTVVVKPKGVRVPHHKNTASMKAETLPDPKLVRIPMSMHIGAPAKPIVKAGDSVKVGQLIAESSGLVSAPIHASISGTVKSINTPDDILGQGSVSITIESDGKQEHCENLSPPKINSFDDFISAVHDCGAVGLGGAGFPASVKLTVRDMSKLNYILINGAECEPYITSDTRTMVGLSSDIAEGLKLLKTHYPNAEIIIGLENNKPEAIRKMQEISAPLTGVRVSVLPSVYPQGGEKVLIYNLTKQIVPEGGLPLDVGVIVLNVTTLATIARYVLTGMPLISKCVTVDGPAVKNPKNIVAPIGTPVSELFEYCGGLTHDVKKVLLGGPMMGIAVTSLETPVQKNTNAVLAFTEHNIKIPKPTPCIRCGKCAANCPMKLMPLELERAFILNKPDLLEHFKVNLCMECGCCSYNCPANRPLVQTMKLSKPVLRDYQTAKKEANA